MGDHGSVDFFLFLKSVAFVVHVLLDKYKNIFEKVILAQLSILSELISFMKLFYSSAHVLCMWTAKCHFSKYNVEGKSAGLS